VAFLWAGPDWRARLTAAFAPLKTYEAEIARIDAWVSPPDYTGRPPVLLTEARDGDAPPSEVVVPQGSVFVLRAPPATPLTVTSPLGGEEPEPMVPEGQAQTGDTAPREFRLDLDAGGRIEVAIEDTPVYDWTFDVIADQPPSITLEGEPRVA